MRGIRRPRSRSAVRRSPPRRNSPPGFGLYKFVHRVLHPRVVRLAARAYRRYPLRAWETTLGLGTKRKGVVHRIRARKRRTEGISGIF